MFFAVPQEAKLEERPRGECSIKIELVLSSYFVQTSGSYEPGVQYSIL